MMNEIMATIGKKLLSSLLIGLTAVNLIDQIKDYVTPKKEDKEKEEDAEEGEE